MNISEQLKVAGGLLHIDRPYWDRIVQKCEADQKAMDNALWAIKRLIRSDTVASGSKVAAEIEAGQKRKEAKRAEQRAEIDKQYKPSWQEVHWERVPGFTTLAHDLGVIGRHKDEAGSSDGIGIASNWWIYMFTWGSSGGARALRHAESWGWGEHLDAYDRREVLWRNCLRIAYMAKKRARRHTRRVWAC